MNRLPARLRRSGFTLVELLLGLAIGALLMVSIGYALSASVQSVQGNTQAIEARRQVNTGMEYILKVVRLGQSITRTDSTHLKVTGLPDADGHETWTEFALVGSDLKVRTQKTPTSGPRASGDTLLSGVNSLEFTAPTESGSPGPCRVTVKMTVSVADSAGQSDVSVEASSVARSILRTQNAATTNPSSP